MKGSMICLQNTALAGLMMSACLYKCMEITIIKTDKADLYFYVNTDLGAGFAAST